MSNLHQWQGRWISTGQTLGAFENKTFPAPCFRKEFEITEPIASAKVLLCGLGFHELCINGISADNRVLAPAVTQYTERVSYVEYDVSHLLHNGRNAITILLGNGWYNCSTPTAWHFSEASWRDFPKLLCDVLVNDKVILWSDRSWKYHDSPITFDALRSGEHYDARLELPGAGLPGYDDSAWSLACAAIPPPGTIEPEEMEPCRISRQYPPIRKYYVRSWIDTFDFGVNLTGFCQIRVRGKSGNQLHLYYTEKIDPVSHAKNVDEINNCVTEEAFQCDKYILKGDPDGETWHPHFTYHGFRYVQVEYVGDVEILDISACFVHSDFKKSGSLETSDETLNHLLTCVQQSYLCNFVGIPTDCPHREKNGWTADAHLVVETGLWNYNAECGYRHYAKILADTQRKSGQLPGIAPTNGWGYNWGGGLAWDAALFEIPWRIFLFTGNSESVADVFENCRRYLDFCERIAEDGVVEYGLGDWMHIEHRHMADPALLHTAYYCYLTRLAAKFSGLLGKTDLEKYYAAKSKVICKSWKKHFYRGDGRCGMDEWTALGSAIYFELLEREELKKVADRLVQSVRANRHKVDFGFIGAKIVPRALAEAEYADDAFMLYRQEKFPGWIWPLKQGATTLWEFWTGQFSQNHCALGDVSAWMFQYAAGISPMEEAPGFRKFVYAPCFLKQLNRVVMQKETQYGTIVSTWERKNNQIHCKLEVPRGSAAQVKLPGHTDFQCEAGIHSFCIAPKTES